MRLRLNIICLVASLADCEVSTTTRPRLVFTSTRIDFPGIPKELILLRIQFSLIKFIKNYKNLIQIELACKIKNNG